MDRRERIVRAARRRMTAGAVIDGAGRGMVWGSCIALGLVVASRVVAMPIGWWWLGAAPLLVGGVAGAAWGLRGLQSLIEAAGVVDHRLRLKDRLSSGTALASLNGSKGGSDAFQRLAVEEADRASAGLDARRAAPIEWGRSWHAWPVILSGVVAMGLWLPRMDGWRSDGKHRSEQGAREAMIRQLSEIARKASLEPAPPNASPVPGRADDKDNMLREIERELATGRIDPARAAEKGARELARLAGERERAADEEKRSADALRDAMAKLKPSPPRAEPASPSTALADAIRNGDLASAAQSAREMLNAGPDQSAEARTRAATELENLARDLREAERARREALDEPNAPRDSTDRDRDPENSRPSKQQVGPQPDRKVEPNAPDDLARAMEDAARALKSPAEPQPPKPTRGEPGRPKPPRGSQTEKADPKPGEKGTHGDAGGNPNDPNDQSGHPGEKNGEGEHTPGAKPQPSESAEPGQSRDRKRTVGEKSAADGKNPSGEARKTTPGASADKVGGKEPKEKSPSPTDGAGESSRPTDKTEPGNGHESSKPSPAGKDGPSQRPSPSPRPEEPGEKAKPSGGASREDAPDVKQGAEKSLGAEGAQAGREKANPPSPQVKPSGQQEKPDHSLPDKNDGQRPRSGDGLRQLADRLKQLSEQPQDAATARKQAEDMRRQAQELLRNASPEQLEQLRKWGREMAKEVGPNLDQSPGSDSKRDQTPPRSGSGSDDWTGSGGSDGGPHGVAARGKARDPHAQPPARTAPVDARPPTPAQRAGKIPERVIAEWYANKRPDRTDAGAGSLTPEAEQTIHEAAAGGERAVDTEAVPTRYDALLRKYFRRLGERAKAGPAPPAPDAPAGGARPAEPAQDAPARPATPAPKP